MFNPGVEGLGDRILGEPEDVAAADPGQATRPGDEQETQGAQAAEPVGVGPFPRARLGFGERVEQEIPRSGR